MEVTCGIGPILLICLPTVRPLSERKLCCVFLGVPQMLRIEGSEFGMGELSTRLCRHATITVSCVHRRSATAPTTVSAGPRLRPSCLLARLQPSTVRRVGFGVEQGLTDLTVSDCCFGLRAQGSQVLQYLTLPMCQACCKIAIQSAAFSDDETCQQYQYNHDTMAQREEGTSS